jgi:hypothetical protein
MGLQRDERVIALKFLRKIGACEGKKRMMSMERSGLCR